MGGGLLQIKSASLEEFQNNGKVWENFACRRPHAFPISMQRGLPTVARVVVKLWDEGMVKVGNVQFEVPMGLITVATSIYLGLSEKAIMNREKRN